MIDSYKDLIEQTFDFPQTEFDVNDDSLLFNGVNMSSLIEEYGSPLKVTYLPKVHEKIRFGQELFQHAIATNDFKGDYKYCYCTKANHFSFILEEVLKTDADLELSYGFDVEIVKSLFKKGHLDLDRTIICNGYKTDYYKDQILSLIEMGFKNVIPIVDNVEELEYYISKSNVSLNIGIRVATEEEPNFDFYTSRLGIRLADIDSIYKSHIESNDRVDLKLLHFFVDTGIQDTAYYWNEYGKLLNCYTRLASKMPSLTHLNIGGGLPFKDSLDFDYDFEKIVDELVLQIKVACDEANIAHPTIVTEFGKFTVAESGATLFKVLGSKKQNDRENWYMIDGSIISSIPDVWGIDQKFIVLPINKWSAKFETVNIGGLSCDNEDNYNSMIHNKQLFLPKLDKDEPLYIGFFHTGAYQDALSGYGGLKHCLIPSPKHVVIQEDVNGKLTHYQYREEQSALPMLDILGYE